MHSMSEIEKQFPRIARSITLLWGYPEFLQYVDKLCLDHRGDRQGFPREVLEELLFLHSLHVSSVKPSAVSREDLYA
jgi:hypothetical protein